MPLVKICGITNLPDARVAADSGADLLGFIFYPPSPRYLTPPHARAIIDTIRATHPSIRMVGVFVNEPQETIEQALETANLDLAELHGQEPPELVKSLGTCAYKSLQATDLDTAHTLMANYRSAVNGNQPAFIADAPPAKLPGGNGVVADWSVARAIASQFPILLAGGLSVENIQEAIATVLPYGVDVSSGVERAPGIKDHARVREFITRAKQ